MELILIRHAEPVRIQATEGRADPGLHQRGLAQAEALAAAMAGERLDAVWSSPMRRARETAAPLARVQGLDVIVDPALVEFDRNSASYIPIEEMIATGDERLAAMGRDDLGHFGTDASTFRKGAVAAIERVIDAHPSQTVAIVSHGGIMNAYLSHIIGLDRLFFYEPRYAAPTRVLAQAGGRRSLST
ncbi:MAG: histidine phosphatase family protein, partial [Acidimicrobiales bacterium]